MIAEEEHFCESILKYFVSLLACVAVLTFVGCDGDGTPAGVTVDNPVSSSKIVFLGFGLENIPLSIRQVLMPAVLVWFEVLTSVQSTPDDVPGTLVLEQNYPNPFNPSTTIKFSLPQAGYATLKVYDVLGMEIASLVADDLSAGTYTVTWDAGDVASGVYFYRLSMELAGTRVLIPRNQHGQSGVLRVTRKLLLLK